MTELLWAVLIIVWTYGGLKISNLVLDRGVPFVLSRKIGHVVGGTGFFLAPFLFSTVWWPLTLAGGFTILLGAAHYLRPREFRGVGGATRPHALAELYFPGGGTIALAVGWGILGEPWLAVVPTLYMAWGDMVTGLTRWLHHRGQAAFRKYNCGSLAMLGTCLLIGILFQPYWVAAIGAFVATGAEKLCGEDAPIHINDNLSITLSALVVMAGLWLVC